MNLIPVKKLWIVVFLGAWIFGALEIARATESRCEDVFLRSAHAKPKKKRTRRPDAEFELSPRTEIAKNPTEKLKKTEDSENGEEQFPFVEFIDPMTDPEYHQNLAIQELTHQKQLVLYQFESFLVSTSQGPYPPILRPEQRQSLLDFLLLPNKWGQLLENEFIPSAEAPEQSIFEKLQRDAQYLDHYLRSVSQQQIPFQSYDIDVMLGKMIESLFIAGLGPLSERDVEIQSSFIQQARTKALMKYGTNEYISYLQIPRDLFSPAHGHKAIYHEKSDETLVLSYLLLLSSTVSLQKMHAESLQNFHESRMFKSSQVYEPQSGSRSFYDWNLLHQIHQELFKTLHELRMNPSIVEEKEKSKPFPIQGFKTAFRTAMAKVASDMEKNQKLSKSSIKDRKFVFQGWSHFLMTYQYGTLEKEKGAFGMDFQQEHLHPKTLQ